MGQIRLLKVSFCAEMTNSKMPNERIRSADLKCTFDDFANCILRSSSQHI